MNKSTRSSDIFALPPEILAIILEEMTLPNDDNESDTVRSFAILLLVCKNFRRYLMSAVKNVNILYAVRDKILDIFTGVRRLFIHNNTISFKSFSKNIWDNLEFLTIPGCCVYRLNEYGCMESYMNGEMFEHSSPKYLMINLKRLDIHDGNNICSRINVESMPNLRILESEVYNIENLRELTSLEVLDYSVDLVNIGTESLNDLNIWKLSLNGCRIEWRDLYMTNLRYLKLSMMNFQPCEIFIKDFHHLNLDTLILNHLTLYTLSESRFVMKSLITLQMKFVEIIEDMIVDSLSYPMLRCLNITRSHSQNNKINVSASNLVEIVLNVKDANIIVAPELQEYTKYIRRFHDNAND